MPETVNRFGQPIVPLVADVHAAALFAAYGRHPDESNWTYLPYCPFASANDYASSVRPMETSFDPVPFAILAGVGEEVVGVASYLRVNHEQGSIGAGQQQRPLRRIMEAKR